MKKSDRTSEICGPTLRVAMLCVVDVSEGKEREKEAEKCLKK